MDTTQQREWVEAFGQKRVFFSPATRGEFNEMVRTNQIASSVMTGDDTEEGYLVRYVDHKHYTSWTPRTVADAAYCPNGRLGFGHALNASMEGKVATRVKWVHDDYLAAADIDEPNYRWITLGAGDSALVPNKFWNASTQAQANKNGGFLAVEPYLIHFNGTSVIMGWLPSHEDLIATDWFVADTVQDILVTAFGFLNTKQSDSEPVAE